ncbi:MAG: ferredoxin [Candidatus Norongarragalinales archaeon]
MAKTLVVEKKSCIGCGACASLCPKTFRIGGDGKSEVFGSGDGEECVQRAIDVCPVQAISWKK